MNPLQLWRLRRFCEKHGLDYQLIDNSLTYDENLKYLSSLVPGRNHSKEWESQLEWYQKEHFLTFYISCILDGETKSKEVGEPISIGFSLKKWVNRNA